MSLVLAINEYSIAVVLQTDSTELVTDYLHNYYFEKMCFIINTKNEVAYTNNGKPYFMEDDAYHFNTSYTKNIWCTILAEHAIGVNLELWKNETLIQNVDKELLIKNVEDWCIKQCIIKCLDTTIDDMVHIHTTVPKFAYTLHDVPVYVKEISIPNLFCGFIASTKPIAKLDFYRNEINSNS
jgi:hypothetical protein